MIPEEFMRDGVPDFVKVVYAQIKHGAAKFDFCDMGDSLARSMTEEQRTDVRLSDSGACGRSVWARKHGLLDLEIDADAWWSRLGLGTMCGIYLAKLFQDGIARLGDDDDFVELESTESAPLADGVSVPGHMDVIYYRNTNGAVREHVYELKSTYTVSPHDPAWYHWYQASHYSRIDKFDNDMDNIKSIEKSKSIVLAFPAIFATKGPRLREFYLGNKEDEQRVTQEAIIDLTRLVNATSKGPGDMPEIDVAPDRKGWECKSCLYSACEQNRNPAMKISEEVF